MRIASRQGPRSRPRRLFTHTGSPLPPIVSGNLVADYQLAGQSGNTIVDSSPNAYNGNRVSYTNSPTFISSGLSFTTGNQGASIPVPVNQVATVQVLVTCNGTQANSNIVVGNSVTAGIQWGFAKLAFPFHINQRLNPTFHSGTNGSSLFYPSIPPGVPTVMTWSQDVSAAYTYFDSYTQATQDTSSSVAFPIDGTYQRTGSMCLGINGFGITMIGTVHRVLMYSSKLSDSDRQSNVTAMKAWSNSKGITTDLHDQATTSVVVCGGDSITAGIGTNTISWPVALNSSGLLTGAPTVYDIGVANRAAVDVVPFAMAELWPLYRPNAHSNIYTFFLGTNDLLGQSSSFVPTVITRAQSVINTALSIGYKVVVMPMICRNSGTSGAPIADSIKNAYNAALASTFTGVTNVTVVPASAYSTLTADGADTNTTYFQSDATHPTNVGASDIAIGGVGSDTGVLPYINALL